MRVRVRVIWVSATYIPPLSPRPFALGLVQFGLVSTTPNSCSHPSLLYLYPLSTSSLFTS